MRLSFFWVWIPIALIAQVAQADTYRVHRATGGANPLENLESEASTNRKETRKLNSSASPDEDIAHYQNMDRHVGVEMGMFIPLGDFQNNFGYSPMLGMHFIWEAVAPFALTMGFQRTSSTDKTNAVNGKLTVTSFNIGTRASFPIGRVQPYLKLEGAFLFNDISFGGNPGSSPLYVTSGNDALMTTAGLNAGIGIDFVIGRELGMGIDATYHYLIPKKVTLSDSTQFDLGSPFATVSIHLDF